MKISVTIAGLALLLSTSVQALDIGVGVKAGTLGNGVDLSVAISPTVNARLALTKVSTDFDETLDISDDQNSATIDATMKLDFGATALLLDWYVFDGTFHLTGGMVKNNSKIDMVGTVTGDVVFDGQSYSISDFTDSTMTGRISAGESYEPYVGIGWGRKAGVEPGLSLSVELGVVLMDPSIDLTAPTLDPSVFTAADQAQLEAEVNNAESAANDDLSVFKVWPVLSIGLNYAF